MYCKSTFNHKGEIFKRFVKTCTWSSQIFFASLQTISDYVMTTYGSHNKTSVYKSWSRKLVAPNYIIPFNRETKFLRQKKVSIRSLFNP